MFKFFKVCSFSHSRLGRGFFSTNSSISEVWLGSDQPVALLIEPSARLYFWIDCFLYFSWKHLIDSYGVQVRHVGWPIKHSDIMVSKPLGSGFVLWAGAKVLLEKENSISIKLFSRWKHKVLQNLLVDGCFDFGLDKTQWTNTSRRHGTPNHHRLRKLHTGLQAACILCLYTLPPDSWPWFSNKMQNLLSSEKRTLGHWATVQFLFSLAQVRYFWRCFWVCWLLMHWLQLQFTPCEALPSALLDSIFKLAVIPVACAAFPTQFLPSNQLCI